MHPVDSQQTILEVNGSSPILECSDGLSANMTNGNQIEKVELDLEAVNAKFADASATRLVEWAAETFPQGLVMSTSFGHSVCSNAPHGDSGSA